MISNLTSLYNQLKPTLNHLNVAIDEIEYINEKSNKSKVLEALLHDMDYHNFLKYNLKNSTYACCLMIGHKTFANKIIEIWKFVYSNRKNIIVNFGNNFSQKDINYIGSKFQKGTTINNFPNEDKLRLTKILHTIKEIIPKEMMDNFLKLTNEDIKKISFSQTISIVEGIRKIGMATDKELYSLKKVSRDEWKIFLKNNIDLENSVLYNYFLLPEKYENNFDIFYKQESKLLIEKIDKIKSNSTKNELLFQYNVLKTYNDIRQTFDIIIHLSSLELFILKLFYGLDIKSFFGNNVKYIEALYVFHFSHSYKQAEKIIFLCEKNYYLCYLSYILATFFFLIIGNLISIVGFLIVVYAKKIANYIKTQILEKINFKIDLQIPIKFGGALIAIFSLLFSPYLDNIKRVFVTNPLADMISAPVEEEVTKKDTIDNTLPENTRQDISIIFTGFDMNITSDIQKDIADLKNYIVNIETNKNLVQKEINENIGTPSKPYHGSANKDLGIYKLERQGTFYDIVNSYISDDIQGLEREILIKQIIRNYVSKNRTYIRQQVSANGYDSWGLGDLYMLRFLPSGFEINLDELLDYPFPKE